MIQTCIFDIDGTLSRHGKPVDASITRSIEALRMDKEIIFASARPIRDILPLLPEAFHDALIVGCNGGMVWQKNDFLHIDFFGPQDAALILAYLKAQRLPYVLDGAWHYSFSAQAHPFHDYIDSLSEHKVSEAELLSEGVTKILILDEQYDVVYDFLTSHGIDYGSAFHQKDRFYDLMPSQSDKYLSLSRHGIDFSSVAAFGNDTNDFLMLDHAQVSVFVGEASVYERADYYCAIEEMPAMIEGISERF